MRKLLSKTRLTNLSDDQRDLLLGLLIILVVAILYYFQWAYYLTGLPFSKVNIDYPQRYFWWANDSRDYQAAGEWLFGRSSNIAISVRPWLYPLLLGLSRTLFAGGAERVMWLSQLLMWLASGVFIYLAINNLTRSRILAILGAGLYFSHPSPLILTFHGLSETLNILLIAAFCWVLTTPNKYRLYYALLLIALATITKPIYLPFLLLLAGYIIFRSPETRLKTGGLVALLMLPIWIQLLLSSLAIGRPTLSTIGSFTFKNYLVADVYLQIEGTTWREAMTQIDSWDVSQQLTYLWDHQRTTALTIRSHLIDSNLLTGSFFALGDGNVLRPFSIEMNIAAAYLHLIMLPLVIYYLLSKRYQQHKQVLALLYLCFGLQWLTSFISSGQEDRLLITALPLWIIVYPTVLVGMGRVAQGQPAATSLAPPDKKGKPRRQKQKRT